MKTYKYDVVFNHGFGMKTSVRVNVTQEGVHGIVALKKALQDAGVPPVISLISLVLEGEDEDNGEA